MSKRIGEKKIRELIDRWKMRFAIQLERAADADYSESYRLSSASKASVYSDVIDDIKDLLLGDN
jgi:hypothetical protein